MRASTSAARYAEAERRHAWTQGYACALAEVHRRCGNSTTVCEAARDAGITIAACRAAGVESFDCRELQRAGVPG